MGNYIDTQIRNLHEESNDEFNKFKARVAKLKQPGEIQDTVMLELEGYIRNIEILNVELDILVKVKNEVKLI